MTKTALLFTDGMLDTVSAKTAHGLILGASRYKIVGIIDAKFAGQDAGTVIIGKAKHVPIFSTIQDALNKLKFKPDYGVIGIAPIGGKMPETLMQTIKTAIASEINIVSGLHSLLCEQPEIAQLAKEHGVELIDIRKPKKFHELHMWNGKIATVSIPRIAVLGTDCAIGKRTTTGMLLALCKQHQINAEMIYTGQTGWLQGMRYGLILDSTLNDFVSGELEHAILKCAEEAHPDVLFIEGQSSLRNPSGPCGSELILSARSKYVVLQHTPAQKYFICDKTERYKLPEIEDEIQLIKAYGADVVALTLNSQGLHASDLQQIKKRLADLTHLPVIFPREEGVESLLPMLNEIINTESQ